MGALGFLGGRAVEGRAAADRLADELVSDHLRVLATSHPLDVESTDSHQVKPWFEGRLDFASVVPGDRGELRLAGGSVGYVMDRKAAVASYALRRHRLTLLAFPRAGLPGLEAGPGDPPSLRARRGFEMATWVAGDVAYALVGDVPGAELDRIALELAAETRR
jgi:anti-sigma factor RsiW